MHSYLTIKSDDSEVDLIYFEVWTDNQEFCGQAVVPLSCLKTGFPSSSSFVFIQDFACLGLRSVQLYDRFNERLDMSALLIDIHPDSGNFRLSMNFYEIFSFMLATINSRTQVQSSN